MDLGQPPAVTKPTLKDSLASYWKVSSRGVHLFRIYFFHIGFNDSDFETLRKLLLLFW
jgi:hypothetical protein